MEEEPQKQRELRHGVLEKWRKNLGFGALIRISTAMQRKISPMLNSLFLQNYIYIYIYIYIYKASRTRKVRSRLACVRFWSKYKNNEIYSIVYQSLGI
jgi:hypothetical protein